RRAAARDRRAGPDPVARSALAGEERRGEPGGHARRRPEGVGPQPPQPARRRRVHRPDPRPARGAALGPRGAGRPPIRGVESGHAWELIPRNRYLGNAILSLLTKIASGYWHVADSQAGYAAISLPMLDQLDLDRIYQRYGFPNDLLVHLNIWNARVRDFPSRPI